MDVSEPMLDEAPSAFPARWANAIPDLALATVFAATWIAPTRFAAGWVRWALLTMLLEFVVIHSAAFMGQMLFSDGAPAKRALRIVGLGAFYTLFVAGFALGFHSWWPLVSFWLLTLNRMSVVWFRPSPGAREREMLNATWAAHCLCYLAGAFVTTPFPVPRLGFTPAFVSSLALPGSGLWIQQPWRVIAFGTIYFGSVAAFELTNYRWLIRAGAKAAAAPS